MSKLIVKTLKPRNPFIAASYRGNAGAHRSSHPRQTSQVALRRELAHLEQLQERHKHSP